ncbi:MAG: hypothetical protein HFH02_07005 [Dorea sp.]|nr:hypothetical protein [Dorea sp.]
MTALTFLSAAASAEPKESMGDVLSGAGMTILTGIVVVFGVLVLLTAVFILFGKIMVALKGGKKTPPVAAPVPVAKPAAPAAKPVEISTPEESTTELIAVISAAVAAMAAKDGSAYQIRSVRRSGDRSSGARPIWATAGLMDSVSPF